MKNEFSVVLNTLQNPDEITALLFKRVDQTGVLTFPSLLLRVTFGMTATVLTVTLLHKLSVTYICTKRQMP